MDIVRNPDGTLVVPIVPERRHDTEEAHQATKIIGEVLAELD
jgi:hypothetical protein